MPQEHMIQKLLDLKNYLLIFLLQAERDVRIAKELDLKLVYASKYVHCKEGQSKISY